jgi:hypothetical protein
VRRSAEPTTRPLLGFVAVLTLALVTAFLVSCPSTSEETRLDLYRNLSSARFSTADVPRGFKFLEVHGMGSPGPGEDEVGIVYATFRGPDAINRAFFRCFPTNNKRHRLSKTLGRSQRVAGTGASAIRPTPHSSFGLPR